MEDEGQFVEVFEENELSEDSVKLVDVEGTPVLLVKVHGEIFAFDNRCPHMSCGFSGGVLEGDVIICPCHEWRFNLKTGECENEPAYQLVKFVSKVESGKIWVKPSE